jgi:uncharacterized membrane protein YkvA (DUF1232 family)
MKEKSISRRGRLHLVYNEDFYQGLRRRVRDWAEGKGRGHQHLEYILLAPDLLHLMVKLTLDRRVPAMSKVQLGIAIAYFVSPLDLCPEAVLGPIGYIDDVAVAAWVLNDLIKTAGPEVVLDHWAGDRDLIALVARITSGLDEILGSGLVRRLKKIFESQSFPPALSHGGESPKLPLE